MRHSKILSAFLLSAALMACPHFAAKLNAKKKPGPLKPNKTLYLYPQGQNKDIGIIENGLAVTKGPGKSNGLTGIEVVNKKKHYSNISDSARIEIFLPAKPKGQMVLICPGGGYLKVCAGHEGDDVAAWLVKQGIAACIIKYRLPNEHWEVPLTDVQNAFRYCRAHAAEWKVEQIGIMGFSAGGHLAACASTLYTDNITKPDFSVLIYPVITMSDRFTHKGSHDRLIGSEAKWSDVNISVIEFRKNQQAYKALKNRYSLEKQVNEKTPPTFIASCVDDDVVPIENSLIYFMALKKHKVPVEFMIYPKGGHGWGFRKDEKEEEPLGYARKEFLSALEGWLRDLR